MDKNISFETAMKELEQVVASLESGDLTLEDALKTFEKGISLTAICNEQLDQAEKKITMLLEKKDGTLEEKDFLTEEI
jgi:exodeoxyribonuclease VII small subunit